VYACGMDEMHDRSIFVGGADGPLSIVTKCVGYVLDECGVGLLVTRQKTKDNNNKQIEGTQQRKSVRHF
jgi:hypothetical protein